MSEEAASEKLLTKTLTFGVHKLCGYDNRKKEKYPLPEEKKGEVFRLLTRASRAIAQACNMLSAQRYSELILGVPQEARDAYKPKNPAIRERLADCAILGGGILSQAYKSVEPHFSGEHGKDLLYTGKRRLPTHKTDGSHPIPIRGDGVELIEASGGEFWIAQCVFEAKWAKENQFPNWICWRVFVKKRDKTLTEQLRRVVSGEWKLNNSRLLKDIKSGRWRGQIMVSYAPQPYKNSSPKTILGIDLGVTAPAAVHVRVDGVPQPWALVCGRGREMLQSRQVVRADIVRIVRALRAKDSGLVGRAREEARVRLRDLRQKEKRIIKTASQKIAAQIAEISKRNGAGTWQVEDLGADIKEEKPWLARNWAPGTLMDALRWHAVQLGVEVRKVNPRYTSQRCSRCGFIDRRNRPKGNKGAAHFQCVSCGHKENADKNAARNLSTPGIEDLISEAIKAQDSGRGPE